MKLSGSKNHLHVLIYICIISFFTGCGGYSPSGYTPSSSAKKSESIFPAEYYILKKQDTADYDTVLKYTESEDLFTSAEAYNILGYYHIRDNDFESARKILVDGYTKPGATRYIKTLNELWRMDMALSENDYLGASVWAKRVKRSVGDSETVEGLHTYCRIHRIMPEDGDYYSCVAKRLEENISDYVGEPLIENPLNILVTSSTNSTGGVLYYYTKNFDSNAAKNFLIRIGRKYREGDWDFIIDIDNAYLAGRGYGIYFKPDISSALRNMDKYVELKKCENVVIGSGEGLYDSAAALRENISSVYKINVKVLYLNRTSVTEIRNILKDWENEPFCAIAAGTEQEIDNFIPTVRQYTLNTSKQRVFIIKPVDTGMYHTSRYVSYYGNSDVFTLINLNLEEKMKSFAGEYARSSGKEVTYDVLIGYDMMHFINKLTVYGMDSKENYITGVAGFKGGMAVRELKGFHIGKTGRVEELDVIQYYDDEDENGDNGEDITSQEEDTQVKEENNGHFGIGDDYEETVFEDNESGEI